METNGVIGAMIIDSDGLCLSCKYIYIHTSVNLIMHLKLKKNK